MSAKANYTVKELATLMGVSERTARRYLARAGVAGKRMGNGFVYWVHDLKDRMTSEMASMGLLEEDE